MKINPYWKSYWTIVTDILLPTQSERVVFTNLLNESKVIFRLFVPSFLSSKPDTSRSFWNWSRIFVYRDWGVTFSLFIWTWNTRNSRFLLFLFTLWMLDSPSQIVVPRKFWHIWKQSSPVNTLSPHQISINLWKSSS